MHTIDRLDALDAETFRREYLSTCRPVVLTGLASAWPAVGRWTVPYLREHAGHVRVSVRRTDSSHTELDDASMDLGYQNLRHMLDECTRHPELETYTPGIDLHPIETLCDDLDRPAVLDGQDLNAAVLFVGQHGRGFGHMHPYSQALLCQVTGTKTMDLYAPSDLGNVHMRSPFEYGFWRSKINFHNLDAQRYPRLARAHKYTVVLQPGDALFIPVHWLHVPTSGHFSAAVTFWWPAKLRETNSPSAVVRSVVGVAAMHARQLHQRVRHGADLYRRGLQLRLRRWRTRLLGV
jgi:hypothetical protein